MMLTLGILYGFIEIFRIYEDQRITTNLVEETLKIKMTWKDGYME